MPDHKAIADPEIHEPKGVASASVDEVYHADGAGSGTWKKVAGASTNVVTVNSITDFPAAVAGVITLAADTTYVVGGQLSLGTDRIVMANNSHIMGTNPKYSKLTYTGSSALITAASGVTHTISDMALSAASGTCFSLTGGGTETAYYRGVEVSAATTTATIRALEPV